MFHLTGFLRSSQTAATTVKMSWIISVCTTFKVFANFSHDVQTEKSRVTRRETFNHFQSKHENSVHSRSVLHLIFSPALCDFPTRFFFFFFLARLPVPHWSTSPPLSSPVSCSCSLVMRVDLPPPHPPPPTAPDLQLVSVCICEGRGFYFFSALYHTGCQRAVFS